MLVKMYFFISQGKVYLHHITFSKLNISIAIKKNS